MSVTDRLYKNKSVIYRFVTLLLPLRELRRSDAGTWNWEQNHGYTGEMTGISGQYGLAG